MKPTRRDDEGEAEASAKAIVHVWVSFETNIDRIIRAASTSALISMLGPSPLPDTIADRVRQSITLELAYRRSRPKPPDLSNVTCYTHRKPIIECCLASTARSASEVRGR